MDCPLSSISVLMWKGAADFLATIVDDDNDDVRSVVVDFLAIEGEPGFDNSTLTNWLLLFDLVTKSCCCCFCCCCCCCCCWCWWCWCGRFSFLMRIGGETVLLTTFFWDEILLEDFPENEKNEKKLYFSLRHLTLTYEFELILVIYLCF